jgi:hypothetical protein
MRRLSDHSVLGLIVIDSDHISDGAAWPKGESPVRNHRLTEDERQTRYLRKQFAEGESLAVLRAAFDVSDDVCQDVLRGMRTIDGKRPGLLDDYQPAIDKRFMTDYLDRAPNSEQKGG